MVAAPEKKRTRKRKDPYAGLDFVDSVTFGADVLKDIFKRLKKVHSRTVPQPILGCVDLLIDGTATFFLSDGNKSMRLSVNPTAATGAFRVAIHYAHAEGLIRHLPCGADAEIKIFNERKDPKEAEDWSSAPLPKVFLECGKGVYPLDNSNPEFFPDENFAATSQIELAAHEAVELLRVSGFSDPNDTNPACHGVKIRLDADGWLSSRATNGYMFAWTRINPAVELSNANLLIPALDAKILGGELPKDVDLSIAESQSHLEFEWVDGNTRIALRTRKLRSEFPDALANSLYPGKENFATTVDFEDKEYLLNAIRRLGAIAETKNSDHLFLSFEDGTCRLVLPTGFDINEPIAEESVNALVSGDTSPVLVNFAYLAAAVRFPHGNGVTLFLASKRQSVPMFVEALEDDTSRCLVMPKKVKQPEQAEAQANQ